MLVNCYRMNLEPWTRCFPLGTQSTFVFLMSIIVITLLVFITYVTGKSYSAASGVPNTVQAIPSLRSLIDLQTQDFHES